MSRAIAQRAVHIALAEAEAGAREVGGSNTGVWVDKYLNANHPEQQTHTGEAWCAAFVCWAWKQAAAEGSVDLPIRFTRGCTELLSQMRARSQAVDLRPEVQAPLPRPEPGDAAFYDLDRNGRPNHVNLVLRIDEDGNLWTVGGNEGDKVQVKNRGPLYSVPGLMAFGWWLPRAGD